MWLPPPQVEVAVATALVDAVGDLAMRRGSAHFYPVLYPRPASMVIPRMAPSSAVMVADRHG